jgi:hypothetical protein
MKQRVKKYFYGLEKEFDLWWDLQNGGYDIYLSLIQYNWWNDPFGKRRKRELILAFNTYIMYYRLE